MLSYVAAVSHFYFRCSEIHETLDECFDEEFVLNEIESAVDEICVESMERDAADDSDFVVVDAPNTSVFMQGEQMPSYDTMTVNLSLQLTLLKLFDCFWMFNTLFVSMRREVVHYKLGNVSQPFLLCLHSCVTVDYLQTWKVRRTLDYRVSAQEIVSKDANLVVYRKLWAVSRALPNPER